ncbi:MAG: RIP metalloprotease RseP [Parcubacteria group bacterium]
MLLTIILFLLLLSLLVFVHELGHFYFARKFGVKVDEFGFGIPPRIFGLQFFQKIKLKWGNSPTNPEDKKTLYSLNWIPLGGFVKLKGEEGDFRDEQDSFASKKIWQRMIILSAGVVMNAILCAVCLAIAFMIGAPQVVDSTATNGIVKDAKIQIVSVLPDSIAEKAGLKMGDAFLTLDNIKITTIEQLQNYLAQKENKDVAVGVDRYGERLTVNVQPKILAETNKPGIGVALAQTGIVSYPWYKSIWFGIVAAGNMFIQIIVAFYNIIKNAILGNSLGVDVAGPVGIAVLTGQMARMGFVYLLQFAALLSMNLAIINFLPFPALDGGRFWFLIVEKIRRKPVKQSVEQLVHTIGFMALLALALLITGRDIWKMIIK